MGWFSAPLLLFILFRIAILIIFYRLTGGSEFSSDTWVYNLGLHPLSVLTFTSDASLYSQPPFFPIVMAPLALFLSSVTNDFLAARISYTLIEFLMFLVMALYVARGDEFAPKSKRAIMTILALSPLGFMTGAIMCEEESIVALFTAIVLLAVRNRRFRQAAILVILGVLTGKILFGIAFVALLFVARNKKEVIYNGILPAVVILTLYSFMGYLVTGITPFLSFSPSGVPFCSSAFNIFLYFGSLTGLFMKWLSLTLLAAIFAILWPYLKRTSSEEFPAALLLVFCALFLIFYHMNVEYYIFALPLLAIVPYLPQFKMSRTYFNALHFTLGITSWGYAIVYGIRVYSLGGSASSHSKELALRIFNKFLGFVPLQRLEISLLAATLLIITTIAVISFRYLRRRQLSAES